MFNYTASRLASDQRRHLVVSVGIYFNLPPPLMGNKPVILETFLFFLFGEREIKQNKKTIG